MNLAEKYIIPHQTFRGMYDGVLRILQSDRYVTNSERKLLAAVSEAVQNNDEKSLTRQGIGRKIGVGEHQVGNITKSLKKKNWLKSFLPACQSGMFTENAAATGFYIMKCISRLRL